MLSSRLVACLVGMAFVPLASGVGVAKAHKTTYVEHAGSGHLACTDTDLTTNQNNQVWSQGVNAPYVQAQGFVVLRDPTPSAFHAVVSVLVNNAVVSEYTVAVNGANETTVAPFIVNAVGRANIVVEVMPQIRSGAQGLVCDFVQVDTTQNN